MGRGGDRTSVDAGRFADGAGALAAIFAALCCAGLPLIVSVLATLGLSFLRSDAILLPLMAVSLSFALWGFWRGRRLHGSSAPLLVAVAGALALIAGVVFIHGVPANEMIGVGAVALVSATAWNAHLRRSGRSAHTSGG